MCCVQDTRSLPMPRNRKGIALCIGPKKRPKDEQRPYVTKIVNPIMLIPTAQSKAFCFIEGNQLKKNTTTARF